VPVVEIYTKTFCPYCWRAKTLLESKGVAFNEISVDFGGPDKQVMVQRHVGGCDDLIALDRDGKLDGLIAA
jgi:glutaredoxin 3